MINEFGNFIVSICKTNLLNQYLFIQDVMGHGRLRYPPSRASMWRDGYPTPPDYNDNQGFCGGQIVI